VHAKLVTSLKEEKMTEEGLLAEVGLTPAELISTAQESAPPQGDVDPDDDGTFGIGGRCRLGLAYHWARVREKNSLLAASRCPTILLEELVAAQLYTGAMYLKYNNVLRFFSGSKFLQDQCVKHKLGIWVESEGATKFEWTLAPTKYATTIHGINSCIVKLSGLTEAVPVYRGVAGMRMPLSFFEKNAHNVAGGVEYGFSSTTTSRETAVGHATEQDARTVSTVIEAHMGMVDRGADIGFLSQYPGEREILYGPLTGMEVRGTRVDGATLVIVVHQSVNQKSLTLEQVVSKRREAVVDMTDQMQLGFDLASPEWDVLREIDPGMLCASIMRYTT